MIFPQARACSSCRFFMAGQAALKAWLSAVVLFSSRELILFSTIFVPGKEAAAARYEMATALPRP